MTQSRFTIADVVPHRGTMSLLEELVDFGDDWLRAAVTLGSNSLFADSNGVPAWVGIEYMAQAVAAYGGVQRRLAGLEVQVGFLVGARKYTCNVSRFPLDTRLSIEVTKEYQADNGLGLFQCKIHDGVDCESGIRAEAGLNVFLPDSVEEFLAYDN